MDTKDILRSIISYLIILALGLIICFTAYHFIDEGLGRDTRRKELLEQEIINKKLHILVLELENENLLLQIKNRRK
jgi:hypothetical protein